MVCAGSDSLAREEKTVQFALEQKEQLLRTKLFVPPIGSNLVPRPHLRRLMNANLEKALILVSAPAGYGKTTLVSSWLQDAQFPVAWVSLDEGDNDSARFLQYFIAALRKVLPAIQPEGLGIRTEVAPVSQDGRPVPYDLLNILLNEIAESDSPFLLVLDDFHTIHAQAVLDILAYLLTHLPPQMHLLIISRTDPPVPLFRLRARNQMAEIRADQLRFTSEEIAAFLNGLTGLRLSPEELAALERRTEGWVAGLQLAALSMRGRLNLHGFVSEFAGSHHYIMDYLTEEVLQLQPETVRSFLLQTSILTSMCGALCDAVIDREAASAPDGQAMLEALDQQNLFVIPLDDRRSWYRYHHLFADILKLRLEHQFPEKLPELHRRAAGWYLQNDIIPEAIQHFLQAGDRQRVAELVEQHGCSLLMRGEGFTLLKWIQEVDSYAQTHPWLAILKAWGLALTGNLVEVEPALRWVEAKILPFAATFEGKVMLGSMATVRAFLASQNGEAGLAAEYARGALEYLPDSNDFSCSLRSVATSILGDASQVNGNLPAARQAYLEAVKISQAAGNRYMNLIASSNLAGVLLKQGELHQAALRYSLALQSATRPDGQPLPFAAGFFSGLGEIYYEWNHLEEAAHQLHRCIEICEEWGGPYLLAKSSLQLAWLERARCNLEAAQRAIRAAEQITAEPGLSAWQGRWIQCAAARWWLAQERPEKASQFLHLAGVNIEGEITYPNESEYLLLLRLLLAQGEHEAALSLSERLLPQADANLCLGQFIEILVLQALAWQGKQDTARSLDVLKRALALAQPEGYVRTFLDEGESLVRLLYQAKLHQDGGGYADALLSGLEIVPGAAGPPDQLLIEALTPRELEVLKLIEAGCSNQEIAGRLVISLPTVKRHISNIYTKLGVRSRTQAISLGKELKLIQ